VRGDVPVNSDAFLVTGFMNLKIKPVQSFRDAHRDRVCVHVFIWVSVHTYISIYVYTVFLKKIEEVTDKKATRHMVRNWGTPDCTPK
jgi:hypothetical protein